MNFPFRISIKHIATAMGLALISTYATAEVKGTIGIGADLNNSPSIYKDIDDDLSLGIHLQYRGDKFNINKDSISYKINNADKFRFEILGNAQYDGYEAQDSKLLKGMDDRDPSFGLGGRASMKTDYGLLSLEATSDITGTHHGQEADLRFGPEFYRKSWDGERQVSVGALAGLKWQSNDIVDYYYGVKDSEATANRKAYTGKSALTPYIGVDGQVNLSKHLTLNGAAIYKDRPNEITNSPIVDKDSDFELNAGMTYWF